MKKKVFNTLKYIFSGGLGFLINISVFWILVNYTHIWYVLSSIISFLISTFAGFILHKTITYSDKGTITNKKISSYYILNIINILTNALLIYLFVEYLMIEKIWSLIFSNILISIYSFNIYKKLIFKS